MDYDVEIGYYTGKSAEELEQIYYEIIDGYNTKRLQRIKEEYDADGYADGVSTDIGLENEGYGVLIGYDVIGDEDAFGEYTDLYFDLLDFCDYVIRTSDADRINPDKFAVWLGATSVVEIDTHLYIESYYYA